MLTTLLSFIFGAVAVCHANASPDAATLTHAQAQVRLRSADIGLFSTQNCHDRNNGKCTSLEGIHAKAINDLIALKRVSHCQITVTGGTETGHTETTYSHGNGWKLDVRMNQCLKNYIEANFRSVGNKYYCDDTKRNTYLDEDNHYDINFGISGKC